MIKFLKKILSIFLILNHLWVFNIIYAAPLDIHPDHFMDGRIDQDESVHKMQLVHQENGSYHVSFSDSLSNMADNSSCFLFDEENQKIIGRLIKNKGILGAFFSADSVHLKETPKNMVFNLEAEGSLCVGGSVQNHCVLNAKKITFDEKIDTPFFVSATACEIQVNTFLKGESVQLNATEKGYNNGQILSKTTGILNGHWENRGVIASLEDVLCKGSFFYNTQTSAIIAGKSYQNSCESASEEGSIKARLGSILSGSDLTLKDCFHFEGASFSTLHQNLWFDDDKSFSIQVQNFINMQCDFFKGYANQGKFSQDRNFNATQSVVNDLSSYFPGISLNQTEYIPQENAFVFNVLGSIPDLEAYDEEKQETIHKPVATLEWFPHILATDGAVILKADTIQFLGSITHGHNAFTLLKGSKQIETFSNALGKRVYIDSPINFIEIPSDNEDYTFLKADELYFVNQNAKNNISQNLLVKKVWADCQDIGITGDILGYDHEPMPQIFLSAPHISIKLHELEASQFIVQTGSMAFYWNVDVTIQEGYIDGKYYTLSDQSYVSFREFLDAQKRPSTIGKMVIDASLKSVYGDFFVESLQTKGRYFHLEGNISGNYLSMEEEEAIVSDAKLKFNTVSAASKTFIQTGESTVKLLVIDASKYVRVSQMFAQAASISDQSQNNLQAYISDSNIQNLFMDVAKGSVLLKDVIAQNAKVLGKQFDAMGDLTVGNLAVNALSNIRIQRVNVEKSLTLEAGKNATVSSMNAENATIHMAAQGNTSVDHANLRGCTVDVTAQGVTSVKDSDIQGSLVQLKGQYVGLSQTTVEQSAVHAQGDVVHMTENDIDASQITAQGTRVALSENEINNSTLQARAIESVTVDQTTGTGNTFHIESDQVFMADNTLDQSRLYVKANRAYIDHLFGSYDDFQLKVNHLRLSGEALVQHGSIEGRDEGVLPYLDISDRFKVHLQSKENMPRPSFVIKCQGYSNLHGVEVDGDGEMRLEAKDLTLRPDFTHLEGYAIYLDIAPKSHQDVIKLAQDLSRVANVEMNARDVVLMLESGRIYFSENLTLHLKGAVLNESTIEGAGNLSLISEHNIEMTKSFLSAKGELVAFAGGHLIRTGSKTYSGKGTSLISGADMKDLAYRQESTRTERARSWFWGFEFEREKETHVTHTVCEDESDTSVTKTVNGHYQGQAPIIRAPLQTHIFNGSYVFEDVHDEYHYHRNGGDYEKRIDRFTSIGAKFIGKKGIIYSNGVGQDEKTGEHIGLPGIFVNPEISLETLSINRMPGLPMQKIEFRLGENTYYFYEYEDDSNIFWNDISVTQIQEKTYSYPKISGSVLFEGPLNVLAQKAIGASRNSEKPKGFFSSLINQTCQEILDPLRSKETDYLSHLKIDPEQLEIAFVQEFYKEDYQNISGPGIGLFAIVAIVVTVCTMGAGSAIAGSMAGTSAATSTAAAGAATAATTSAAAVGATTAATSTAWFASGTISAAVANAGFTSLCVNYSMNLINTGNPFESFTKLFEKDSLKSLAISMCTAGLTQGVFNAMGFENTALAQNAAQESLKAQETARQVTDTVNKVFDTSELLNKIYMNIHEGFIQSGISSGVQAAFGADKPFSHLLRNTFAHAVGKTGAGAITDLKIDGVLEKLSQASVGAGTGALIGGKGCVLSGAAASTFSSFMAEEFAHAGMSIENAAKAAQISGAFLATACGHNPNVGSETSKYMMDYHFKPKMQRLQNDALREQIKKEQEAAQAKAMQDAEAKEIAKERARQSAEKKAKAEKQRNVPLTKAQKDAYKALAHDVTHPFGDVQEEELKNLFYDQNGCEKASTKKSFLDEQIEKTETLQRQAEADGRIAEAEYYAKIASRLHTQRPPSPTIQDTKGRQAAHRFSDRFIPDFVKKGAHFIGQEMHDMGQDIDDRFNAFLKNPSLKTFQDADFTLKATKEILGLAGDVIGTTVDHAKSFARRGLRVAGMDAGNAQDFVDMAEIATCVAPVMRSVYGQAASSKIGVKTASALRSAIHEIKSATRFGIDVLEDYAQFKARGPQLVYARSRTFDPTFTAPKRAHSSILFQERSSRFNAQGGHQSSKAPAAPKAQEAAAAASAETKGLQSVGDSVPVDFPQQTTREKLFGTNDVKEFSNQRVRPINDRMPINSDYAGKTFYFDENWLSKRLEGVTDPVRIREVKSLSQKYPDGVPFTGTGHPDFSRYAVKKVEITFSGESKKDIRLANKLSGFSQTPDGKVWHHHHDSKTLMLIDRNLHDVVRHTGGDAIVRSAGK
ncbi:MAG: hypothetical protein HEEMFOPI_01455 [Holosporales bacterium]